MIAKTLKTFLDREHVRYETITHPQAFTAQEVAESTHITGKAMAKTVMVVIDGAPAMAVVPANQKVELDDLCECAETDDVRLARHQ